SLAMQVGVFHRRRVTSGPPSPNKGGARMRHLLIIVLVLVAAGADFRGRCVRAVDGDTVDVQVGAEVRGVRAAGTWGGGGCSREESTVWRGSQGVRRCPCGREGGDRPERFEGPLWALGGRGAVAWQPLAGMRACSAGGLAWHYRACDKNPDNAALEHAA